MKGGQRGEHGGRKEGECEGKKDSSDGGTWRREGSTENCKGDEGENGE